MRYKTTKLCICIYSIIKSYPVLTRTRHRAWLFLSHFEFHFKNFWWPLGGLGGPFSTLFGHSECSWTLPGPFLSPGREKVPKQRANPTNASSPKEHIFNIVRKKRVFFYLFWQRFFRPSFLSIFGRLGGALNHENHAKPLYCRTKSRFPKNPKSEVRSRLWAPFWEPFGVILAPLASKSVKKTQ